METISVVIPFYNDEKNFNLFFDHNYSIIKKFNEKNEIILVDDTRNEFFIENVLKSYDNVIIIRHNENKGFSISINDGVNKASNEIVLLLNSDIKLTDETIPQAIKNFQDPKIFGVSFKSIYENGKIREGAKRLKWKTGLPFILHSEKDYPPKSNDGKIYTFYPVGGHCAVRKSMFEKLNGMDHKIYKRFYWEDVDLGFNASKNGWLTVFEPNAVVYHPPENSSIKNNNSVNELSKIKSANRVFFVLKNFKSPFRQIMLRIGLFTRFLEKLFLFKNIKESYIETIGLLKQFNSLSR